MAQIALHVPVFIASSGDVSDERNVVQRLLTRRSRDAAANRLLLQAVRYEHDAMPAFEAPNDAIRPLLEESELVVAIVWSRMGPGVRDEIDTALRLARSGHHDDFFLYMRNSPPPPETPEEDVLYVEDVRNEFRNSLFYWEYATPSDLAKKFDEHLKKWLRRWHKIPDICEYGLKHSPPLLPREVFRGENRADLLQRHWNPEVEPEQAQEMGRLAASYYQANQGNPAVPIQKRDLGRVPRWREACSTVETLRPLSHELIVHPSWIAPTPFVETADREIYFGGSEWFYYFCAVGLVAGILANETGFVSGTPYRNNVHQYMPVAAGKHRAAVVKRLEEWLLNVGGVTEGRPVARNFAAYELGMLGATSAQDSLIRAAQHDFGRDVRRYSVASLGKLRARKALRLLSRLFMENTDDGLRLNIAQAVCRITGVAQYEL